VSFQKFRFPRLLKFDLVAGGGGLQFAARALQESIAASM